MATAMADIHVKVNPEVKKASQELFDQIGITMSDAINMMLKRSILERRIPFDTFIPGDDAPRNMKIDSVEQLKAFLDESAEKNRESGKYYTREEVEEMLKVGRVEVS